MGKRFMPAQQNYLPKYLKPFATSDEEYMAWDVRLAWRFWNLSRAAIEIYLPMKKAEHSSHQSAFNSGIDASAKAIRAAGIKVKE